MLAYALYVAFVSVFAAVAVLGHVLVLKAIYPSFFGTPAATPDEDFGVPPRRNESPSAPKLAA